MTMGFHRAVLVAALTNSIGLFFAGCGSSPAKQAGNDSGADAGLGADVDNDTGTTDDGAVTDTGSGSVAVTPCSIVCSTRVSANAATMPIASPVIA